MTQYDEPALVCKANQQAVLLDNKHLSKWNRILSGGTGHCPAAGKHLLHYTKMAGEGDVD
jgi:hypothetical protein